MRLVKASKYHKCKKGCDIWSGAYYFPQRRNKAICFECGRNKDRNIKAENKKLLIFICLMLLVCFGLMR